MKLFALHTIHLPAAEQPKPVEGQRYQTAIVEIKPGTIFEATAAQAKELISKNAARKATEVDLVIQKVNATPQAQLAAEADALDTGPGIPSEKPKAKEPEADEGDEDEDEGADEVKAEVKKPKSQKAPLKKKSDDDILE